MNRKQLILDEKYFPYYNMTLEERNALNTPEKRADRVAKGESEYWYGICPEDPTCLAAQTRLEEHQIVKSRNTVTIIDKEAWSENTIVCSECGNTKE